MVKSTFQLVLIVVLFQSCVVYNKTSVPLSKAVGQGKVKITAIDGQLYKFKNIVLYDSVYYGMGREYISKTTFISHEGAKTPIDSTKVKSILIKDTRKSKNRTVIFVLAGIPITYISLGVVVLLIFAFS